MTQQYPYQLQRFIEAQDYDFDSALSELKNGRKVTHWIWYIFPQVAGLGSSSMAEDYAIRSRDEALAYCSHEILGPRLIECASALLCHRNKKVTEIMDWPDDLKLKSSMTLFAMVCPETKVFQEILDMFYDGDLDPKTVSFLSNENQRF